MKRGKSRFQVGLRSALDFWQSRLAHQPAPFVCEELPAGLLDGVRIGSGWDHDELHEEIEAIFAGLSACMGRLWSRRTSDDAFSIDGFQIGVFERRPSKSRRNLLRTPPTAYARFTQGPMIYRVAMAIQTGARTSREVAARTRLTVAEASSTLSRLHTCGAIERRNGRGVYYAPVGPESAQLVGVDHESLERIKRESLRRREEDDARREHRKEQTKRVAILRCAECGAERSGGSGTICRSCYRQNAAGKRLREKAEERIWRHRSR